LGATHPAVKTGDPGPSPAATTVTPFVLTFDYRPNASPSHTLPSLQTDGIPDPRIQATPLFAGLVPGYVGLYQINFQVPAPVGSLSSCGDVIAGTVVRWNLTVNLFFYSFDGAEICVAK
jgi:hypothetical protein